MASRPSAASNLAEELLERLLEGEIKSRFAGSVVQEKKFSELLGDVIRRYQNRAIETAQVIEELIGMAKKFRAAASRGETPRLTENIRPTSRRQRSRSCCSRPRRSLTPGCSKVPLRRQGGFLRENAV
jgi:type I site-specific restriction-modification system R (restriction) subunit